MSESWVRDGIIGLLDRASDPDIAWPYGGYPTVNDYVATELMKGFDRGDLKTIGVPDEIIALRNRAFTAANTHGDPFPFLLAIVDHPAWFN